MALFGSFDVTITYDTTHDMTSFVQSIAGISVEKVTQDSQPFGVRTNEVKYTGAIKVDDIVITGLYDNASPGPKDQWGTEDTTPSPATAPKPLTIAFESGSPADSITIPVLPAKFEVKLTRNGISEYVATLKKGTGDITVV